MNYPKIVVTHHGKMHCDEAMGSAELTFLNPAAKILRLTVEEAKAYLDDPRAAVLDTCRVYDAANWNIDHHQGIITDPDGFVMATAGLVWRHWGLEIIRAIRFTLDIERSDLDKIIHDRIARGLMRALDAHDADGNLEVLITGSAGELRMPTLPSMIGSMNGGDLSDAHGQDIRFDMAVELCRNTLSDAVESAYNYAVAVERWDDIATLHENGLLIVLEEFVPWQEKVDADYPDVLMVAFPTTRPESPWGLQMVPQRPGSRKFRKGHPGLEDVPGLNTHYIHVNKFIAGCRTYAEMRLLAFYNIDLLKKL